MEDVLVLSVEHSEVKKKKRKIDPPENQGKLAEMFFWGYCFTEAIVHCLLRLLWSLSSDLLFLIGIFIGVAGVAWLMIPGENGFWGRWDTDAQCRRTFWGQQGVLSALSECLSLLALLGMSSVLSIEDEHVSKSIVSLQRDLYLGIHIVLALVVFSAFKKKRILSDDTNKQVLQILVVIVGCQILLFASRALF